MDYTKTTNFAAKDALASGNPSKVVTGTGLDTEFNNIATAVASKANSASPTITSPTLVTPALGTPASGNLSNCTNIPGAQVTGTVANATNVSGGTVSGVGTGLTGTAAGLSIGGNAANATTAATCSDEIGVGQTWGAGFFPSLDTQYQNLTGKPIMVNFRISNPTQGVAISAGVGSVGWTDRIILGGVVPYAGGVANITIIVPKNHYYGLSSNAGTSTALTANILQ